MIALHSIHAALFGAETVCDTVRTRPLLAHLPVRNGQAVDAQVVADARND